MYRLRVITVRRSETAAEADVVLSEDAGPMRLESEQAVTSAMRKGRQRASVFMDCLLSGWRMLDWVGRSLGLRGANYEGIGRRYGLEHPPSR
jgi:hypothetical protein